MFTTVVVYAVDLNAFKAFQSKIVNASIDAGADFRILGITFDKSLTMASAIEELVKDCKWKIRSLLRCQRHFDIAGTVSLFKG